MDFSGKKGGDFITLLRQKKHLKSKEIRCRMDKERQECKPKNKMHFIITKQLTDIIITKSIFFFLKKSYYASPP